jgi:hypothetical protein
MATSLITQERLKSLLTYDPDTGEFRWRFQRQRCPVGALAGTSSYHGYVVIKLNGRSYRAHRLAWLYQHGCWPDGELDHVNRQRNDNRITNLREASRFANCQNRVKSPAAHSQHIGVSKGFGGKGWRAYIDKNNRRVTLGVFATEAEAVHARYEAERQLYAAADILSPRRDGVDVAPVGADDQG